MIASGLMLDMSHAGQQAKVSRVHAVAGEASIIVALLAAHQQAGLPCSSMGVIAPFRSQVMTRKTHVTDVEGCWSGRRSVYLAAEYVMPAFATWSLLLGPAMCQGSS